MDIVPSHRYQPTDKFEPLVDAELVRRYCGGDERAFEALHKKYDTKVLRLIQRIITDREQAEDLAQETFFRVYKHVHKFDRTKRFSTWIFTIAANLAKNELRDRSRRPLVLFQAFESWLEEDGLELQFEDKRPRPDKLYEKRFMRKMLLEAVDQLPDHQKTVFTLRELDGRSYEEISALTDANLGTVKSRLNRARMAVGALVRPRVA